MTEAEKIAARAKIFANLGLGPDGMCPTTPPILSTSIKRAMDDASRTILSESELAACAAHDMSPSTFLIARGSPKASPLFQIPNRDNSGGPISRNNQLIDDGRSETTDSPRVQGSADDADDPMVEAALESLAKYTAGVGGPKNRDHLFAAQAAIARALKRS